MPKLARIAMTAALAATVVSTLNSGTASAANNLTATKSSDTQLDAKALYFVSYDGLVNNDSFQQSGIVTYNNYQYATWYTSDRDAVIARRALPNGAWQTAELPHALSVNDSHNVISIGISPQDGVIHLAMDTHDNPVYYFKSVAGLASNPSAHSWSASDFGSAQRTLDGVDLTSITYPQFLITPDNKLQLSYRTGQSGNGTNELAEYDNGTWTKLGKWSSGSGSYTATNGGVSTIRNMYLHGITYGPNGRLYAAYTWREGNNSVLCASGGIANHDTGYAYSDDNGRTWKNNSGATVATTGSSQISVNTSGMNVDSLDTNHALMNQESLALDSANEPHVLISYVPGRFTQCVKSYASERKANGRTFFLSRASDGTWKKIEIPVAPDSSQRSKLAFDKNDNAFVVMPYGRIVAATKASGYTDWKTVYAPNLNAFGEVDIDTSRLANSGIISVLYQQSSSGTTPSPIKVAEFTVN